ncbi:hypothetical protein N8085_00030 [Salibacteraceae bacterium]|nr:hypothetical protein [Salibacteraceae bacterium]
MKAKKSNDNTLKAFVGFGGITILAGLVLTFEGEVVTGLPGILIGAILLYFGWSKKNSTPT